ncbi:peptidoglycan-binding domain-containing protein [Sorangium sp. So ce1335]|uniref:peptidoglycan-binding domain-containing protein n=1 Tax=Sorangium sp. So ce1335 TaxID=3133335 RepID=UPI003F630650
MGIRPYVVRQGDYLTQLAHRRGFSAERVWEHPSNEALRRKRPSPEILQPGDVLYLPDAPETEGSLPLTTGGQNRFTARVPTVEIKLILKRADGTPVADEPFRVTGTGPEPFESTTDGAGLALFPVPAHLEEVSVSLDGVGLRYRVRIGHMDPADEPSGIIKRLAHLGYLPTLEVGEAGPSSGELTDAVAAFQEAHGLAVTGTLDDATRDAIVQAHGS